MWKSDNIWVFTMLSNTYLNRVAVTMLYCLLKIKTTHSILPVTSSDQVCHSSNYFRYYSRVLIRLPKTFLCKSMTRSFTYTLITIYLVVHFKSYSFWQSRHKSSVFYRRISLGNRSQFHKTILWLRSIFITKFVIRSHPSSLTKLLYFNICRNLKKTKCMS